MAVRDYSKGKIYKIVVDTKEKYEPYVGSTVQGLAERMGGHRGHYKSWKKRKGSHIKSYDLFDKFGVENCKIILLEEYPCDSKMKLLQKEREWYDKIENCNEKKPFISKEELVEHKKIYYEQHKEHLIEKGKIYRDEHKEEISERDKKYCNEHKEEIAEKKKETFTCDCGSICRKSDKVRHDRSLKHQNYLSSLKV